jgi:hypothetical protein
MRLLMTLVLVLLVAGCAAGEDDATGSTTKEQETTAHNAEQETTAHNAEETTVFTEAGNLPRPPKSTLFYGGREVTGELGSYCWSGACVDVASAPSVPPGSKQRPLSVPSGSKMLFHFRGQNPPDTVQADAYKLNKKGNPVWSSPRSLTTQGLGVEWLIAAKLPSGEYALNVFVTGQQGGDASYSFRVVVE